MPSQKRCLAQLTCDKQKIALQPELDRSSTQIPFGTSSWKNHELNNYQGSSLAMKILAPSGWDCPALSALRKYVR
jgi:hypothetical protein